MKLEVAGHHVLLREVQQQGLYRTDGPPGLMLVPPAARQRRSAHILSLLVRPHPQPRGAVPAPEVRRNAPPPNSHYTYGYQGGVFAG